MKRELAVAVMLCAVLVLIFHALNLLPTITVLVVVGGLCYALGRVIIKLIDHYR